jgi:PPK2 family polyphosphate:nucleotide phosphotransferase
MIRHVMYGVNPQGCEVFSFQPPNPEELKHDFLWRAARRLPERGRIGIFNRSYYEEVLIVRVHPELLEEETPAGPHARGSKLWELRYRSIVDFERHLSANGTHIVKFFLHLSRAEQRRRFLARIDEPGKNWKFSGADIHERAYWKQYMKAYGQCLGDTSSRHAPWHIVPADSKDDARVIVSRVIVERLRDLKMTYPKLDPARRRILRSIRKQLER